MRQLRSPDEDPLRRCAPTVSHSPQLYCRRDEQDAAKCEPRVPQDLAPLRLESAHLGSYAADVRCQHHFQHHATQKQAQADNGQDDDGC